MERQLTKVRRSLSKRRPLAVKQHCKILVSCFLIQFTLYGLSRLITLYGLSAELRVYTPKFASFVVRMIPYFNDTKRKQRLPEVACMIIATVGYGLSFVFTLRHQHHPRLFQCHWPQHRTRGSNPEAAQTAV